MYVLIRRYIRNEKLSSAEWFQWCENQGVDRSERVADEDREEWNH